MSILLIKRATDAVLDYIFSPESGLREGSVYQRGDGGVDSVDCPFPDCGAACSRTDISASGRCRYCGGYIAAWLGVQSRAQARQ